MSRYVHASALMLGEYGVLVRGDSGTGKSRLVLALLALAQTRGIFARLVGDDRIGLDVRCGRLVARAHPDIAGQIEQRGIGIVVLPHEAATIIGLVVDLAAESVPLRRLPDDGDKAALLEGVQLPRLLLAASSGMPEAAETVLAALKRMD